MWSLLIAGTVTHYFSTENIGDKVQCNKLKIPHVRTKRYNPGKLHSKPCDAPQNSNWTLGPLEGTIGNYLSDKRVTSLSHTDVQLWSL